MDVDPSFERPLQVIRRESECVRANDDSVKQDIDSPSPES